MTTGEFADLVSKMRKVQKDWERQHIYTSYHDSTTDEKKFLERQVDKILNDREKRVKKELEAQQGILF